MATPELRVRKVEIDFADAKVHWSLGQPEYSQLWNALSVIVPYLEPFLIKAMRGVPERLPEDAGDELRRDVDLFINQEARHFKLHMKSNKRLREEGYDIAAGEARAKADYERFLTRGHKFALAYCEGFETFGPILTTWFFDDGHEYMQHYDEASCFLWTWHMAEEWEHRTVANYSYKAIYDDYWYRLYGLWFASVHLFSSMFRLAFVMIKQDRENGVIKDPRWKSNLRFARITARMLRCLVPKVISPCHRRDYDPGTLPAPQAALDMLAMTSEKYGLLETA